MDAIVEHAPAAVRRRAADSRRAPCTPEEELAAMKAYAAKISKSKEDSIDFLKRAGILDKKTGKLAKQYRS